MTETPATPAPEKTKKHFLDTLPVRFLFTAAALAAPLPLLIALTGLWQMTLATKEQAANDSLSIVRQIIDGTGDAPVWLLAIAFFVPLLLLAVLYRRNGPLMLAMALLMVAAMAGALFYAGPLLDTANG